jgi:hypothetical protein
MRAPWLLLLGGGHCSSVLDCIDTAAYSRIGIVDNALPMGSERWGVPVLSSDAELPDLFRQGCKHGFVTIAAIERSAERVMDAALAPGL